MSTFTDRRTSKEFDPELVEDLAILLVANDPSFGLYKKDHWQRVAREVLLPWMADLYDQHDDPDATDWTAYVAPRPARR